MLKKWKDKHMDCDGRGLLGGLICGMIIGSLITIIMVIMYGS